MDECCGVQLNVINDYGLLKQYKCGKWKEWYREVSEIKIW